MDTKEAVISQFFRIIETTFGVLVRSEEEIVLALLKGETYSRYRLNPWDASSTHWVYDSEIEGRALALGIPPERLAKIFNSLERQRLIIRKIEGDPQGGSYPKHAFVPMRERKVA